VHVSSATVIDRNNIERFRVFYTQPMSPSTSAATKTTIVIVSKTGALSECIVDPKKETTLEELTMLLSKKCGFRNPDGFSCYHTWRYKNKHKYSFVIGGSGSVAGDETVPKYIYVDVWAKTDGRAGQENKYELPPPIDELIMFGNMALIARIDKENAVNLTIELWTKIYEKLFGGFEDLTATAAEDELEIDELEAIPACKKTSNGYLKDGFVIEDDSEDTPRCKRTTRARGKKPKSESTESEFVTETDTESVTPTSESMNVSDEEVTGTGDREAEAEIEVEAEIVPVNKIVSKRIVKAKRAVKKQATGTGKSKKTAAAEESNLEEEIESELSEESYD
jgi:hypothetical protein